MGLFKVAEMKGEKTTDVHGIYGYQNSEASGAHNGRWYKVTSVAA